MAKNNSKILVVTGTRAEYGLLGSTIDCLRHSKSLSLCLVVTGMHTLVKYGKTINEIKKDGVPISHVVPISNHDDMLSALAKEINGLKKVCLKEKPSGILVLGDRDEPFAAAIVGGHLRIPVFHIQGGDVTGFVIDEYIRHSITKFSHLHFTASQKSYERVLKLGEEKWRVFNVGAPGLDNLRQIKYFSKKELATKLNLNIDKKWLVILQHPTPLDKISVGDQIKPTLNAAQALEAEKILIYPNNDTGSGIIVKELLKYKDKPNFHLYPNLDRLTYLSLLRHADALVGNSSSGIIESGFFHLPVINIGNRQLGRESGQNIINVYYAQSQIKSAVELALTTRFKESCRHLPNLYGLGQAGKKIVKIIEAHIKKPDLFYKKITY